MAAAVLAYKTVTVGNVSWVPLLATIDCNYFSIFNQFGGWFGFGAQSVTLCSDPNDATTQKPLGIGMQEILSAPPYVTNYYRYRAGDIICYAKADSGSAELILTFVG